MCFRPYDNEGELVKCGYCLECLIQKSMQWSNRVHEEAKDAVSGCIVTMTYSDDNVPWIDTENGPVMTCLRDDVRRFIAANRRHTNRLNSKEKLTVKRSKYFAAIEYGEETMRPNYHIIIFNLRKETIKTMSQRWNKGFILIKPVNTAGINYVVNYMSKKFAGYPEGAEKYGNMISQGMGESYIKRAVGSPSIYMNTNRRRKEILPPYYVKKMYNEKEQKELKEERIKKYEEFWKKKEKKYEEDLDPFGTKAQESIEKVNYHIRQDLKKRTL